MDKRTKKILTFIFLTFFWSWLSIFLFLALGFKWNTPYAYVEGVVFMFGPLVSAIITQKLIYKEKLKKPLRIYLKPNRWFLIALIIPLIIAFATFGVSLLFPGVEYTPGMEGIFEKYSQILSSDQIAEMKNQLANFPVNYLWIIIIQSLFFGATVNALAAFGEELGWRGFLQRELEHIGFWKSSLLIGFIWGVWHAPIILQGHNYPEHPIAGVFIMILWTMLLAPVFSYVTVKANSVIAASIIHGSLNATVGIAIIFIRGGSDLLVGVTGLAGMLVLLVINVIIFIIHKEKKPFYALF